MATFFLSSFLHHVAISGQGFDEATHGVTWPLPLFFTMQGVGVVLEGEFRTLFRVKWERRKEKRRVENEATTTEC